MAKRRNRKTGLPPGSIVYTGNHNVEKVYVHHLRFNEKTIEDIILDTHDQIVFEKEDKDYIDWYDVRGLQNTDLIKAIGKIFNIHDLILEDAADINRRAKYEEFPNGNYLIIKALSFDHQDCALDTEQVAIYFRKGLVITFQENKTDLFSEMRKRIHESTGKIRSSGADYLTFALADHVVDHYFTVLDDIEDRIEWMEEQLSNQRHDNIKEEVHKTKRTLIKLRKTISPLREALNKFAKSESPFVEETSLNYIRDVNNHTFQVMDTVDTFRDVLNGIQDLYLSEISMKMNQIMKVLTIITTIFVPLSFMAALYGMNFEHMPELTYRYGYFIVLFLMFIIFAVSLVYFKRKKWF